jgi:hypothetical protein
LRDAEFVLVPLRGGETPDALTVHLTATGLLFTRYVMMPYLGSRHLQQLKEATSV